MTTTRTRGEIEDAVSTGLIRFEQEYMGRGPKRITSHVIEDAVLVRLRDVLTPAEQHLIATRPPGEGSELVKRMRAKLIDSARPALGKLVESIVGHSPSSVHHHICTETGEEVVVFLFAQSLNCRNNARPR